MNDFSHALWLGADVMSVSFPTVLEDITVGVGLFATNYAGTSVDIRDLRFVVGTCTAIAAV